MKRLLLAALAPALLSGCLVIEERRYREGPTPLTTNGVISMNAAGKSESFIVGALHRRGVDHRVSGDELILLQEAGVSDLVMTEILEAPVRTQAPVVERRRYYYRHDPILDEALHFGSHALAGYLFWKHFR